MVAPVVRDVELEPPRSGAEGSQGRVQEARVSCWTGRGGLVNCNVVAEFGPTTSYGTTSPQTPLGGFHRFTFGDLTPGSYYHFRLKATDPADVANPTYTQDYAFFQTPASIPPGPTVTVGAPTTITTTGATINWTTATACPNGQIVYGPSYAAVMAGGTPTTVNEVGAGLRTSHTQALTGLTTVTRYYYRLVQPDATAAANVTTTGVNSFVTI
jgi:hypothetical protein